MTTENAAPAATSNALPSLADIASQFAGKSMMAPEFTKPTVTAPAPAAEAPAVEAAPEPTPTPTADGIQVAPPESSLEKDDDSSDNEKPAEEKKDPVSARFAALSRRERAAQQREQEVKSAEQRIKDLEARLTQKLQEVESKEQNLVKGKRPLDVLKAAGFTYQQATEDVMGGYKPPEPDPIDEKLKPVQERLSKLDEVEQRLKKWEEDLTQQTQANNLKQVNDTIKQTVNGNADRYEYVQQFGEAAVDLIRDVMVQHYTAHNEMLSYEQACDRVEEYYEEEIAKKLLATKKVQQRFAAKAPTPATKTAPVKPSSTSAAPKTLTADMSSAGNATIDVDKMPKRDALQYLAKQLKFI